MRSGTSRLSGATLGTSSVTCPSRIGRAPNRSRSTFFTSSSGSLSGPRSSGAAAAALADAASRRDGEGGGLEECAAGQRIAHETPRGCGTRRNINGSEASVPAEERYTGSSALRCGRCATAAHPDTSGITCSANRSISSSCGLHCSSSRSTPAASNSLHPLGHLLRRADQPGAQPAVRHRVVLERHALLELRVARSSPGSCGSPASRCVTFVMRSSSRFASASRVAHDRVRRHAVLHRRQPELLAPRAHVGDLRRDALRRIAVHHVRVARRARSAFFAASDSPPA